MWKYVLGTVRRIDAQALVVTPEGTGLGLEIFVVPRVLATRSVGESVELWLYHHRTDVSESLFGFETTREEAVFRQLLKVSGVGGKTALALLGLGVDAILGATERADDKLLASVPGVGKKTAMKILIDLKSSLSSLDELRSEADAAAATQTSLDPSPELIATLVGMGYDRARVADLVKKIPPEIGDLQGKTIWMIRALA